MRTTICGFWVELLSVGAVVLFIEGGVSWVCVSWLGGVADWLGLPSGSCCSSAASCRMVGGALMGYTLVNVLISSWSFCTSSLSCLLSCLNASSLSFSLLTSSQSRLLSFIEDSSFSLSHFTSAQKADRPFSPSVSLDLSGGLLLSWAVVCSDCVRV